MNEILIITHTIWWLLIAFCQFNFLFKEFNDRSDRDFYFFIFIFHIFRTLFKHHVIPVYTKTSYVMTLKACDI